MEQIDIWSAERVREKRCRDCHQFKALAEYAAARENKDRLSTRCKPCWAAWKAARRKEVPSYRERKRANCRKYYQENREWLAEGAKRAGRKKYTRGRAFLDEAKSSPCMDCGKTYPAVCMDFDHRDGVEKSYSVSRMIKMHPDRMRAEIAKCDLVCANCHRIRTSKRQWRKRLTDVEQ